MSREYFTRQREEERAFSRAVKVKGGTTVYLAGVTAGDDQAQALAGDIAGQTRAAFGRLREAMELVGGTLDNIVSMTVFLTDSRYGDEFVEVRSTYFQPNHYPVSALITISHLDNPAALVEIQAVASLDE